MPATWNLPRSSNLWDQQDKDQYHRLPVWMAMQQTKKIPYWSRWKQKYGTIKWQANMGDIMQGIIAENSPVNVQKHTPKNVTEVPLKTVVRHFERSNTARVKRHLFESPLFHFLPSFRDFRKRQLKFASEDLTRQIGIAYDMFVRWQALQQARYVYVCANATAGEGPLLEAAFGEATDTTEPKDTSWFGAMADKIGPDTGFLDFRTICAVRQAAREDLMIPPWEGMTAGGPKENETVKGKFILTGGSEIYEAMTFDTHVLNTRPLALDLLHEEFKGIISGNIAFLAERYPLRFSVTPGTGAATFPAPELEKTVTDSVSGVTVGQPDKYETVPNPDYVNAGFGVAFFEGHQPFESIDVGPPPSEFTNGSISMKRFNKLNWNGEVRITDDVLVNYGSNNLDTNKYGEYLQLIADTVLGIIPNTPRYIIPVIYRRIKYPSLTAS